MGTRLPGAGLIVTCRVIIFRWQPGAAAMASQSCLSIVPLLMTEWTLVLTTKRAWVMSCRVGDQIFTSRASELWRLIASEQHG